MIVHFISWPEPSFIKRSCAMVWKPNQLTKPVCLSIYYVLRRVGQWFEYRNHWFLLQQTRRTSWWLYIKLDIRWFYWYFKAPELRWTTKLVIIKSLTYQFLLHRVKVKSKWGEKTNTQPITVIRKSLCWLYIQLYWYNAHFWKPNQGGIELSHELHHEMTKTGNIPGPLVSEPTLS